MLQTTSNADVALSHVASLKAACDILVERQRDRMFQFQFLSVTFTKLDFSEKCGNREVVNCNVSSDRRIQSKVL